MITHCPTCGLGLRAGWIRCPRCRKFLPDQPIDAPAAGAAPRPVWLWPVVGVAVLAFLIVAAGLSGTSSQTSAPQTAQVTAPQAASPGVSAPPTAEQSERRTAEIGQHQSDDARRAGYAAYTSGDLAGALSQYEAAVAASPADAEARNNLGQVLVKQNRAAEALPHFDEAVRLDPQKWAYRFNRARALDQLKRWQEAAVEYRTATELFPEDYATHYNLGLTLMRLKQYPQSVASLERAVALAPGEPSFLISLGTAYVAAEKPDRAKATFQQFLELAPSDPEAPRVKALLEAFAAAEQK